MLKAEERIKILSDIRYDHLKIADEMEDGKEYDELHEKIDHIADEILNLIKADHKTLSFEFIFQELTKLGQAPCLLYDDNGFFAVNGEAFSTVNCGDEPVDINISHFVPKRQWKRTVREALTYFLFDEE